MEWAVTLVVARPFFLLRTVSIGPVSRETSPAPLNAVAPANWPNSVNRTRGCTLHCQCLTHRGKTLVWILCLGFPRPINSMIPYWLSWTASLRWPTLFLAPRHQMLRMLRKFSCSALLACMVSQKPSCLTGMLNLPVTFGRHCGKSWEQNCNSHLRTIHILMVKQR